jgi:hypothetical protein
MVRQCIQLLVYDIRTIMFQKLVTFSSLDSEIPALLGPSVNPFSYPFQKCYDFIMMIGKVHIMAFNTALHSRCWINWEQIIQRLCLEKLTRQSKKMQLSQTNAMLQNLWSAIRTKASQGPKQTCLLSFFKKVTLYVNYN